MEREVRLHASLQHDHIIQLYGAFEDDRHVYLAQEFATGNPGPQLFNWVSSLQVTENEYDMPSG